VYCAENHIYTALPKMAKAAQTSQLKAAFEKHHMEMEGQIVRLEKVFGLIDERSIICTFAGDKAVTHRRRTSQQRLLAVRSHAEGRDSTAN
jgi:ferritin-like metal-binding protein YciE